jgi:hypothetical protein
LGVELREARGRQGRLRPREGPVDDVIVVMMARSIWLIRR